MQNKRLFLFAGYDKDGVIDITLMHYLRSLSALGDIILVMDCNVSDTELAKLSEIPNILHVSAARHGEYDFGSYKRAYQYADEHKLLNKYDWIYLVNDSVYGPLSDISGMLNDLESRGVDLTGMIDFINMPTPLQVQSWFVGLSRQVATADFLCDFMNSVCAQGTKQLVVLKYEVGLSQIILQHGYRMSTYISGENGEVCHTLYDKPIEMLKAGLPFVKKTALQNLYGLQYLYPYTTDKMVDMIYRHAVRVGLPFTKSNIPQYRKHFRLTVFSIPLWTVYCQQQESCKWVCYKAYLFDFIPVGKIFRQN